MGFKDWIVNNLQKVGRPSIRSSINSYLVGIVIGAIIGVVWIKDIEGFKRFGDLLYEDLLNQVTKDYLTAFLSIYKANLTASAILVLLGLIHRYLVKAVIVFNGAIVGIALFSITFNQLGIIHFFLYTLPHGIIEIPALILTGAMGISITNAKNFKDRFRILKNLFSPFMIIAALLLFAALIESFLIFQVTGF